VQHDWQYLIHNAPGQVKNDAEFNCHVLSLAKAHLAESTGTDVLRIARKVPGPVDA
jgi:hypothetical protein